KTLDARRIFIEEGWGEGRVPCASVRRDLGGADILVCPKATFDKPGIPLSLADPFRHWLASSRRVRSEILPRAPSPPRLALGGSEEGRGWRESPRGRAGENLERWCLPPALSDSRHHD